MVNYIVTTVITKRVNSVWAGKARVISFDMNPGVTCGYVYVEMLTGSQKGLCGGFLINGLKFKREAVNV